MSPRRSAATQNPPIEEVAPSAPQTLPGDGFEARDHSFTLQAIMELQRSTGTLIAKIDGLSETQKTASTKLDRLEDKLSGVTHKMYAAGVVLVILVAVSGWVVDKSWSLVSTLAEPAIKAALHEKTIDSPNSK